MDLVLLTHPSFADHDTGPHHPERLARLAAVLEGIRAAGVTLVEVEPPEADLDLLGLVHDTDYIEAICNFAWRAGTARPGHVRRSGILARRRCGRCGRPQRRRGAPWRRRRCRIRGGAHRDTTLSSPGRWGSVCSTTVAITARSLTDVGIGVVIVDWDVHHGNGTQDIFAADPSVLYLSMHQFPFYPGTGWVDETGYGPGRGTLVNLPLPAGAGEMRWRQPSTESSAR